MLYPLKFKPVYKDYIWGGRNLEKLNKKLPYGNVAESWEISCHRDGMSIVGNGKLAGKTLEEVIKTYGHRLVGPAIKERFGDKFPLLIKFIDANKDLSVQVHPNDEYARVYENGESGKNEMWYIMDCKPGSKIVYGLKDNINRDMFLKSIQESKIQECLNFVEVSPGDFIYIPSGTIHAIGEGIIIAEIQQSSNLTYRIYDYNRLDGYGNKRELHINKAIDVIDYDTLKAETEEEEIIYIGSNSTKKCKVKSEYFNVDLYEINEEITEVSGKNTFSIYVVVEGKGKIRYNNEFIDIVVGDSLLIPSELESYNLMGQLKLLKTYVY